MKVFSQLVATALLVGVAEPAFASDPIAPLNAGGSATKARDLLGIELGSPVAAALRRMTALDRFNNQVEGRVEGQLVTLQTCPSGAIFFIETKQNLGRFIVDEAFLRDLQTKLFGKFGRAEGTPGNYEWSLVEPVRYTTGERRLFRTNWMSALVMEGSDGVELDLKMIDFRICWREKEKANEQPRSTATNKVKL